MQTNGKTKMASPAQIKYLHILYRQLNWMKDTYKDMLEHHFGVRSTKDLTLEEAASYITLLNEILSTINPMVTKKQAWLIRDLWKQIDYSNGEEGDLHLNKFLKKYYERRSVEALTKQEAIKLIKQIKQMIKQAKERKGKTTVLKRRTQCNHCGAWVMWVQLKDGRREAFDCDEDRNPTNFHNCR